MRKKIPSAVTSTATFDTLHCSDKFLWAKHCPWDITKTWCEFWTLSLFPALLPLSLSPSTSEPQAIFREAWWCFDQKEQLFTLFHDLESTWARIETNVLVQLVRVSQPGLSPGLTSGSGQDRETMAVFSRAPKSWNQPSPAAPSDSQINTHLPHFTRNTSMPCFMFISSFRMNFSTSSVCVWKYSFSIFNIHIDTFLPPFVPFILLLSFAASGSQRHPSITACLTQRPFAVSQLLACGQMCCSNT